MESFPGAMNDCLSKSRQWFCCPLPFFPALFGGVSETFPHEQIAVLSKHLLMFMLHRRFPPRRGLHMSKKCSAIHFHLLWLQSSCCKLMNAIRLLPTLLRDLCSGFTMNSIIPKDEERLMPSTEMVQAMGPNYTLQTCSLISLPTQK